MIYKKLLLCLVIPFLTASLVGCDKSSSNASIDSSVTIPPIDHESSYYYPDLNAAQNDYHIELFRDTLLDNGYYVNGENNKNYNTPSLEEINNVTPRSISDVNPNIDIFSVNKNHEFLMYKGVIYRFDPGSVLCMFMWDYDSNGVADVFTYAHSGSGRMFHNIDFFDMSALTINNVFKKDITEQYTSNSDPQPSVRNNQMYVGESPLTYNKETQEFSCGDYFTPSKARLA